VRTAKSLNKHLNQVLQVYSRVGINIRIILIDRELEKIKEIIPAVECNTMAAKKHVGKEKCSIRTFKEFARGLIVTLPFNNVPRQIEIKFLYFIVLWLNAFPVKTEVRLIYSPFVCWHLDYKKHCGVLPGTYWEVHDEPSPSIMMVVQMRKGIALGLMGNLQGTMKFYCLNTGQVLKCCYFTPLPIPDRVIK
jgi:hypothetical protein